MGTTCKRIKSKKERKSKYYIKNSDKKIHGHNER